MTERILIYMTRKKKLRVIENKNIAFIKELLLIWLIASCILLFNSLMNKNLTLCFISGLSVLCSKIFYENYLLKIFNLTKEKIVFKEDDKNYNT